MPKQTTQPSISLPLSRRLNFLLAMPKFGIGLLIVSVIALVFVLQRTEYEEQRQNLIADALWLEQSMSFQITNSTEKLEHLAISLTHPLQQNLFQNGAAALIKQHAEIDQVLWLGVNKSVLTSLPNTHYPRAELNQFGTSSLDELIDNARRLGKTIISPVYLGFDNIQKFEAITPVFSEGQHLGSLIAVFSLRRVIDEFVPWWFAEKYQLDFTDEDQVVLLSKSKSVGEPYVSYELPLENFRPRLFLRASAVKPPYNPTQRFFIAAIVLLAIIVLISLWAIRGQLQKRLHAEHSLRESHAFRKAMEDSLLTGLRARDLSGQLIYVNPAFCQMVGFRAEELIGKIAPMPYWPEDTLEETMRLHQSVMHGQAPREGYDVRLKRRNATGFELFDALIYEAPLINGEGVHVGWMGSVLDITERKRNEEFHRQQQDRLQHTSRLVAMGEMASTLAHELNQPLSAISSYTTGCLNKIKSGTLKAEETVDVLGKISNQSQRAGRIIKQVQDFIRKREPKRQLCAVSEIVDEAFLLFEAQARQKNVRIERRVQGYLPEVMADPTMIEQVVINLLRNATEAMAETAPEYRVIRLYVEKEKREEAEFVVVKVSDQGPGITPKQAEKLFTPFFTTKAEGLGMGLSICRSIIEFHRGHLTLQAGTECGATFTFTLPIEPLCQPLLT